MTEDDKRAFGEALAVAAEVYDVKLPTSRIAAYFGVLSPFPIESVVDAIHRHALRSKFFPKPSELVELMEPDRREEALYEWSRVLEQLPNAATARTDNAATHRAVQDLGGFMRLAHVDRDQLVWAQREFLERYVTYAEHGIDYVPSSRRLGGPAHAGSLLETLEG
jgi:hypothetical protein